MLFFALPGDLNSPSWISEVRLEDVRHPVVAIQGYGWLGIGRFHDCQKRVPDRVADPGSHHPPADQVADFLIRTKAFM